MSREIKFRIWDAQFEKFVDPKVVVMNASTGQVKGFHGGEGYCDKWVVEQFTGEQDSEGNDIYEGDDLMHIAEGCTGPVEFINSGFMTGARGWGADYLGDGEEFTIIGNIHENQP